MDIKVLILILIGGGKRGKGTDYLGERNGIGLKVPFFSTFSKEGFPRIGILSLGWGKLGWLLEV